MTASLSRARAALLEQARQPAEGDGFGESVIAAVRRVVPCDGYCLIGLDPHSGMRSFMFSRNGLDDVARRLAYNEVVETDANRYVDLARAKLPVGRLSHGVHRQPVSPRLHEILRPAGFASELRLALRGRGLLWGALVLFREDRRRAFTEEEAELTLALAEPLATAVRRYPVRRAQLDLGLDPLPPGAVILDKSGVIVSMTAEARAWLADLCPGGVDEIHVEDALRVVYDVAFAVRERGAEPPTGPECRVRTNSGRWLLVRGSQTECGSEGIAVILQPASLRQLLPAAVAWFGLTPRETDVFRLIARGMPAKTMARQLHLSVLTINDHLAAIYRKADVCGREELLALLT